MSVAADLLKRERHARVVAFYPVRALIQDQLEKWKSMLDPLGFSVGFIDGSVDTKQRADILLHHRVVLMTPDVAHAWFMSSLADERVALVRKNLGLLVLDEAHVYDGVFGTNMAFFLRRLQAVCKPARLICSTATLGQPNDFIFQLTGRETVEIGQQQECSDIPKKTVSVSRIDGRRGFEVSAQLLKTLAQQYSGRFLAFADSRKMVELMTAAAHRIDRNADVQTDETLEELADETANQLVPYRAGYESEDRLRIQQALSSGQLRGVVSTSALELGLDIGEVSLVVLLTTPPSMEAFWQRISVSIGVHPWLKFFALPRLRVETNQRLNRVLIEREESFG
jgi:DEAD/DEAH box helicase domain-containing protein